MLSLFRYSYLAQNSYRQLTEDRVTIVPNLTFTLSHNVTPDLLQGPIVLWAYFRKGLQVIERMLKRVEHGVEHHIICNFVTIPKKSAEQHFTEVTDKIK